jgi:hypothetical protein
MSSTELKLRRGTNAEVAAATPVLAEPIVDTTNKRLVIGDGSTIGGIPLVNYKDYQNEVFSLATVGGTANAITLTTSPASALVDGLRVKFKATSSNTGSVTVNVNGAGAIALEKLLGTSLTALTGGEIVSGIFYYIHYDGAKFQLSSSVASGLVIRRQIFTTSGTYTPNTNMLYCIAELVGGGGGGGGSGSVARGGGGGGAGFNRAIFSKATIGASKAVTVGAGGTGGASGNNGNSGGNSSLGVLAAGTGGTGGLEGATGGAGGAGGITVSAGAELEIGGQNGSTGGSLRGNGDGGSSHWGSGGEPTTLNNEAGKNGKLYGGGGSGGCGTGAAGNGANGVVYITEYCSA